MSIISKILEGLNNLHSTEIYEMARVCFLEDDPSIEIFVNTNDGGKIPHFHVWKTLSGRKHEWEVCIKFESSEYFKHGTRQSTVSTKIAKEIDKVLRSPMKKSRTPGITYWEHAIDLWNENNSDVILPDDLAQPDYTKLNK